MRILMALWASKFPLPLGRVLATASFSLFGEPFERGCATWANFSHDDPKVFCTMFRWNSYYHGSHSCVYSSLGHCSCWNKYRGVLYIKLKVFDDICHPYSIVLGCDWFKMCSTGLEDNPEAAVHLSLLNQWLFFTTSMFQCNLYSVAFWKVPWQELPNNSKSSYFQHMISSGANWIWSQRKQTWGERHFQVTYYLPFIVLVT